MKSALCILFSLTSTAFAATLPGVRIHNDGPGVEVPAERIPHGADRLPFPGGELVGIPKVQSSLGWFFPVEPLPHKAGVELFCRPNHDHIPCEFYVATYHCPHCSAPINGDLPSMLPGMGCDVGSCAPRFTQLRTGDYTHPMIAFRFEVPAGESKSFELGRELRHAAIFGGDREPCSRFRDAMLCDSQEFCGTRPDGTCGPAWCPRTVNHNKGPDAPVCPRHCLV